MSRPKIPQRLRVFLGCEGDSERSYGVLLQRFADEKKLSIHVDLVVLRGGDALAKVELACEEVRRRTRNRGAFAFHAALIDTDRLKEKPDRDTKLEQLAKSAGLHIIWQRSCHEALLLRHLSGCRSLQPLTTAIASDELKKRWPEYKKPISASELAQRIGNADIQAAAEVEPELKTFLIHVGFTPLSL